MAVKTAHIVAVVVLTFLSLSGILGAIPMLMHPTGEPWRMPQTLLQYSPFHSYLIPGIILLVANGLLSLWVLWLTVRKHSGFAWWVAAQGCVLSGWLIVEMAMLRLIVWPHYLYGTVALALLVLGIVLTREGHRGIGGMKSSSAANITPNMLAPLPEPVRRYLEFSGVLGTPLVRTVIVKQTGRIRQSPEKPWMQFRAMESYSLHQPGFVWDATARRGGLPLITVRDSYADGKGMMRVKLAGLFPIVNAQGPELDHSSAVRFLNEMMWFPSAFLRPNITWTAIDADSAEVSFAAYGKAVSAKMRFDPDGRVTNFLARRYQHTGREFQLLPWSTPITAYGTFCGLKLPAAGQAVWHLESGDFTYIDLQVEEITYDSGCS